MLTDTTFKEPDYDYLLKANLAHVFSERDAKRREIAIATLFSPEVILYEPTGIVTGHTAISSVAGGLLAQHGPDFTFVSQGVAVGHHGLACMRWQAGPRNGSVVISGTDIAEIADGKIARLWVFIDPPAG